MHVKFVHDWKMERTFDLYLDQPDEFRQVGTCRSFDSLVSIYAYALQVIAMDFATFRKRTSLGLIVVQPPRRIANESLDC